MKYTDRGAPTKSELNFEFGLRKYKSVKGFETGKPWIHPGANESRRLAEAAQKAFLTSNKRVNNKLKPIIMPVYNDKFPQQNTNSIRHMFDKNSQLGTVNWGASLRWNNDHQRFIVTTKSQSRLSKG